MGLGIPLLTGPESHLAPSWQLLPLPAGWDGSCWGQWVLAAPAELFYLISLLLLPRSQSFFRASGVPLGVPQAVGESVLCLLWDGSLSFCQEAGSQQLAEVTQVPHAGTQQAAGGNWVPPWALGAAAIPDMLWAAQYGGLGLPSCTGRALIHTAGRDQSKEVESQSLQVK